ncbi:FRG domain-containing protein [Rhodobacter capsulatus]|uniref:FRG domain protein n=2 Tax=Rhodobacter capsulatus TaxID=1061 RepID=D5AR41_RHOCB|nr:FRG domain protein [Rhodobacter capsulatus SB 1003]TQD35847.1 FRG domain-containing protein [Rhodobacter capsulatus]
MLFFCRSNLVEKMAKISSPCEIGSVTDLLEIVFGEKKSAASTRCFRGQKNASWPVKPSVSRKKASDAESKMFSEIALDAPGDFASDKTMFEKLVRAQHYELPTRLLDVSLNPLVALFFASEAHVEDDKEHDGAIHLYDVQAARTKHADSDTLSLICNLARLTDDEKSTLKAASKDCSSEEAIDSFRNLPACKRLCQFVKMEKPYFENSVQPIDLRKYYLARPYRNNKRIIAQSGAFIASGLLEYQALETSSLSDRYKKILVRAGDKSKIRADLDKLGINGGSLFPEIVSAAKNINARYD